MALNLNNGTRLALLVLLLGMPISTKARMRCVPNSKVISGSTGQTKAIGPYRFDIVPCADEEQSRPATDSQSGRQVTSDIGLFITWLVTKTGWSVREAPEIRFIPHTELVKRFSGGKGTDYRVEALYSETDHTIYLPDSWRPDDLRDRSILLHELVHHLQYLNNVKVTCASEYEWQAFELQIAWLHEQSVEDPLTLLGVNPLFIRMFRLCE